MSHLIHRRRTLLARLLAGSIFLGSLFTFAVLLGGNLPAQQEPGKKAGVVEEKDDKKPKPRVIDVDDEDGPKPSPKPAKSDAFTGDLAAMMKATKHSGIRAMCGNLLRPHDIISAEYTNNRKEKMTVEPLAKYLGPQPQLKRELPVVPLDEQWQPGKTVKLTSTVVKKHTSYEEIAQEEVDAFLSNNRWETLPKESNDYLSRRAALAAAYHVLSEVDTWHRVAASKAIRQGEEWDKVQDALQKKLLEIRERQLDETLLENDWDAASGLARGIGISHPEKVVQERVAKRLAKYIAEELPKGGLTPERLKEVRDKLTQLEAQFPGSSATEAIGKELKAQAEQLFKQGKDLIGAEQNQAGIELLKQALDLYPQLPDLQTTYLRATNAYPILRVGVKDLPIYMDPRVACTESERQAVEMIFEGLVKQVPEYAGDDVAEDYKPALAEQMPQQTAQLVRKFYIARNAAWAIGRDESKPLTATDVYAAWQLLRDKNKPDYAPAWADLIDNVRTGNHERELFVTLKHGFIDPYAAMTFRILPDEANKKDYKEGFARKPFGSGPYRLDEVKTVDGDNRAMIFMANRFYAARPGKQDLPRIREVHLSRPQDPIGDLSKGRLDLLLPEAVRDLGREKLDELRKAAKVVGPLPTRRIYFLAINLRKPVFESDELRQAIAYAIPREEILKNLGFPGDKPLNGPYPAGSWASDPNIKSLDSPPFAKEKIEKGGARAKLLNALSHLSLKYPKDDKLAEAAMKVVADRLDATLKVKIDLEPLDPHELREKVERTYAYDLAYYHYDFPSEAYWLWPLFHPLGTYFGSGLAEDGALSGMFRRAMTRRDPSELQKFNHDIHNHINTRMLIIPLWQLGSYYAIRDGIEPTPIDPLRVLADVGEWWPKRSR